MSKCQSLLTWKSARNPIDFRVIIAAREQLNNSRWSTRHRFSSTRVYVSTRLWTAFFHHWSLNRELNWTKKQNPRGKTNKKCMRFSLFPSFGSTTFAICFLALQIWSHFFKCPWNGPTAQNSSARRIAETALCKRTIGNSRRKNSANKLCCLETAKS